MPSAQALHRPWKHTLPGPQETPSPRLVPLSAQVATPFSQAIAPPWQAFSGRQASPAVHTAVQVPDWHTWLGPQVMPSRALPTGAQTGEPAAQLTWPILQMSASAQRTPATQSGGGGGGGGEMLTPLLRRPIESLTSCEGLTSTFATTAVE